MMAMEDFQIYIRDSLNAQRSIIIDSAAPAKIERFAIMLTTAGYHRVAAIMMEKLLLRNEPQESFFLNAAIIYQREGAFSEAVDVLCRGLICFPSNSQIGRLLIETALLSRNESLIDKARRTLPKSKILSVRKAIALNDDESIFQILTDEELETTFDILEATRCLDMVRLTRPDLLGRLPVTQIIDTLAPTNSSWTEVLKNFYSTLEHVKMPDESVADITGELPKLVEKFIQDVIPGSTPWPYFIGQLTYPNRITLVFTGIPDVIVKAVWTMDQGYLKMISNEHLLLGRLESPNVPRYIAHKCGETSYIIVMTRLPGRPLVEHSIPLPRKIFDELFAIVNHINDRGVSHGDISPWNVLIDESTPYVIDFGEGHLSNGLSKADQESLVRLERFFE